MTVTLSHILSIIGIALGVLGLPSLSAVIIWVQKRIKESESRQNAIELGVQALLRAQMINDYNHWSDKGFAPIYARENFENCWKQYHGLGANGVMDDIHNKFMQLPTDLLNSTKKEKKS